jgi:phage shock protein A
MTLIQRMTRLFKADLHGILDCLEEPEEVVKQTIRDMEAALVHQEQTLAALHGTLQRLGSEEQEVMRAAQEIEKRIDLCFQEGNDRLARVFLRQRLETAGQAQRLARASEDTRARHLALEHTIVAQRAQLAAVVQQLHVHTEARQRQTGAPTMPGHGSMAVTEDEVEVAFLEEKRRRAERGVAH